MLNKIWFGRGVLHNVGNMEKFSFLYGVADFITFPIFTVYLLSRGMSFATYLTIQAWFAFVILAAELPTGAFADTQGRKNSIVIGSVLLAAGHFAYFLGNNVLQFAIAETLLGLGISFRSGADRALVYDSLKNSKRRGATKHFAKVSAAWPLGGMAGSIISSVLVFFFGMRSMFLVTASLLVAVFLLELKYLAEPRAPPSVEKKVLGMYHHIKSSASFVMSRPKMLAVIAAVILMTEVGRTGFHIFQPLMEANGISTQYFGIIYFFFLASAYMGARNAPAIEKRFGPIFAISFIGAIYAFAFLSVGFFGGMALAILMPALIEFSFGAIEPMYSAYLNKFIPSARRATILSFESFLSSAFYVVFAPIVGKIADTYSFGTALIVSGAIAAVSMALPIAVKRMPKK